MSWPEAFTYSVIMITVCGLIGFIFWLIYKSDEGTTRPLTDPPSFTYEVTNTPLTDLLGKTPEVKAGNSVE